MEAIFSARFSNDDKRVMAASEDGVTRVQRLETHGPLVTFAHEGPVFFADFDPGGNRVVTVPEDGMASVWKDNRGQSELTPVTAESAVRTGWSRSVCTRGSGPVCTGWPGPVGARRSRSVCTGRSGAFCAGTLVFVARVSHQSSPHSRLFLTLVDTRAKSIRRSLDQAGRNALS
jgi:WD40 repeat protein